MGSKLSKNSLSKKHNQNNIGKANDCLPGESQKNDNPQSSEGEKSNNPHNINDDPRSGENKTTQTIPSPQNRSSNHPTPSREDADIESAPRVTPTKIRARVKVREEGSRTEDVDDEDFVNNAEYTIDHNNIMRISGESRLLVTASIPAKPERVVFRLESCDQGWADENPIDGPYAGSYTWIEAFIYRPDEDATDAPAPQGDWEAGFRLMKYPEVWVIQRNKRADSQYRSYEIVWTKDTDFGWDPMVGRGSGRGFVQTLRPGDRIGILACAQYAGWVNYIKCAEVEVVF